MTFKCCDCGEDFDTQSLLEQHISIEHLSWSPYWCLYCKQNGVTLKKATKDALKTHVGKIHLAEQFLFIYEPDDAKEEEHRHKLNRSLALEAQDDTAHHSLLSPAPTPVSPSTSSALEPKLEPFEESEFQLPAMSSQFSSPISHCLTCGAQILNDGHKHKCQFLPMDEPVVDPIDNKQEVLSDQLGELFSPVHNLINKKPSPTPMSKIKMFACTVCGKEYTPPLALRNMRMHEDAKMHWGLLKHLTHLKCDLCPAKYHFAKALQLHRKRLHNAEPNTTAQDDIAHHSQQVLLRNRSSDRLRSRSSNYVPDNSSDSGCSWQLTSPLSHCQEPTRTATSKERKTFACTVCGKEYGIRLALRKHEDSKMHWGLLKHLTHLKCDLCPSKYHFVNALRLHKNRVHNAEQNTVQDDSAQHSVLSPAPTLMSMLSTSSALEPKLEPFEQSEFQLPANSSDTGWGPYQEPIRTSTSKAKKVVFTCTVCGKEYSRSESLRKHEDAKMHWGLLKHLTRLECDLCPAKYHFAKAMRLHKKNLHNADSNTAQDDTAHHSLLSPVAILVSLSTHSALEPKLEPFEQSEFQIPANSSDTGTGCSWPFSSPLDPPDNNQYVVSHQLGEHLPEKYNSTNRPTPTAKIKAMKNELHCTVCGKEFSTALSLRKHEDSQMHWGLLKHSARLKCDLCPAKYHHTKALQLHRKTLHNATPNIYSCCWCHKKYSHKSQLLFHQDHRQHHPKSAQAGLQKCPMCSNVFHFKAILKGHMCSHKGKVRSHKGKVNSGSVSIHCCPSMTKCKLCSKRIRNNRASKRKHDKKLSPSSGRMSSTPVKAVKTQCDLCERVFRHPAVLAQHRCSGKPSHRCSLCQQDFDSAPALQLHRENASHQDREPPLFVCPRCNKSFVWECTLRTHKANSCGKIAPGHYRPSRVVDCAGCGKVCKTMGTLLAHRRNGCPRGTQNDPQGAAAQSPNLECSCSMCPQKFNSLLTIRSHQIAHQNDPDSSTKIMSTCVPCSKSLAPSEIDSHLLKVHIKKVDFHVTLVQEDGNMMDEGDLFDGQDLMRKVREKLIVRGQMERPKLNLMALKCKHCGKLFTTKQKLKKHQDMLMKSKLLSAKVLDFIQSEKHLMAKLCLKKCVKLIRKAQM